MDRTTQGSREILALVERANAARNLLEDELAAFRSRFAVQTRMRDSLRSHPLSWVLGTAAGGLALGVLLPRLRPRSSRETRGPASWVARTIFSAVRPLVKIWLADRVRHWLTMRATEALGGPRSVSNDYR